MERSHGALIELFERLWKARLVINLTKTELFEVGSNNLMAQQQIQVDDTRKCEDEGH